LTGDDPVTAFRPPVTRAFGVSVWGPTGAVIPATGGGPVKEKAYLGGFGLHQSLTGVTGSFRARKTIPPELSPT
jgi:hypothetical protein